MKVTANRLDHSEFFDDPRLSAIDGEVDANYLSAALGRAGRPARISHLDVVRLDGGRISANVFSLKANAGAFVAASSGRFARLKTAGSRHSPVFGLSLVGISGGSGRLPTAARRRSFDADCHGLIRLSAGCLLRHRFVHALLRGPQGSGTESPRS
jgi:hypothetical protein